MSTLHKVASSFVLRVLLVLSSAFRRYRSVAENGGRAILHKHGRIGPRVALQCRALIASHRHCGTIWIGRGYLLRSDILIITGGGDVRIGENCSIGSFSFIQGNGGIEVGDNVRIGSHFKAIAANHRFESLSLPIAKQGIISVGIRIGSDCWIGAGVTVLDGVRIGTGAVLAAGAVITRDVPEHAVVGGIPARVLKIRCDYGHQS
ncbi:acyltransferase [Algiphilus sp. NNCM1]|uniref:acyltransferase n=1 Tax=Algiphilus sp. TaxID=1872431 RepID=UPI00342B823C|nr:acyltransferase [Algiphilus acroporae]